ncbi:unnamed protein product [Clonostachys rosea]|uniref:HIT domain-containing protein n=1 Tax=Bionectria ochroleuca TaxID=29856 RepID=A0ABY6UFC3_BIOOC|nr:unnamed protein product [Clonostachys rosea]
MPSTRHVKSASTGQTHIHVLPRDVTETALPALPRLGRGFALRRWLAQPPSEDHWSALNPPPGGSLAKFVWAEMAKITPAEGTTNDNKK